jgi:hypothetical protein
MHKTGTALIVAIGMLLAAGAPAVAQQADAAAEGSWDGLVEVNARRFDAVFLHPGADFRPFTKVRIDEPEVAFQRNWMRDINRSRSLSGRVTDADVARIKEAVSASTVDVFAREFTRAGFEVVERDGPDVLRIRTGIVNLFVNAPDTMSTGRSRTWTANAGEATLVLEARESDTNALLARVIDRREARGTAGPTNRVTNASEFRSLASSWARIVATRLNDLKGISPVPDPLTPGQRLN